ncbi:MAG: PAS domain-containing protein [Phaeodactylibacter sp.]|nr:PAS domain-containing protein [Phaeodactylibacter sp.]
MQEKLMHISSEYINFPIGEMDRRIQESLEEIGRFVDADRAYIIQYDYKAVTASNTHEWCGLDIEPVIDSLQDIPMEEYQLLIDNHLLGNYFIIPDVPNMEEGPAKTNLEQQGIKSLITVPMMYGNYCYGCVGFDSVKSVHQYTERELKLLELFSEILVNTITRAATDKKLQVSQEKLKKLTENVPGALYQMEISPEGEVSFPFISEGINELHSDLSPEVLKNDPSAGFKVIHPEDLPEINEKIEISAANLSPFFADYRAIQPDGKIHWNRAISKPERLDDGTTVWYGIFQDITEQRKLEEVQKYAQELKVKNKELEQFTFVASHDLQEPLRTIRSYSGLLIKRYSDHFDEDGKQFLEFISNASLRMSNLIKGLLEYSQIGRDREASIVDLNTLVGEVLQDLHSSIYSNHAKIEVGPMPTLQGYNLELRQLIQNLLGNAIKFHKPGEPPIVIFKAEEQADYWKFMIQDNGIGINPIYQEKIFTIFQRLHQTHDFEGTGIGLAHCKKIVEMHHGRIWLKSDEGEGATFFFTLKKGNYGPETE